MDYPKSIVSNQKEESISIQRVNNETALQDWLEIFSGICIRPLIKSV